MDRYQKAMLVQALEYASRGWHVIPCSYKKRPLTKHGFKDGTTDREQIQKWWNRNPKSRIGICTGRVSGFWVVDIDRKGDKDGLKAIVEYFGEAEFDKESWLYQRTATGGYHLCFQYDDKNPVGCGTDYLPGVDIRGDGGYIIAAPSTMKVGDQWNEYEWKDLSKEPTTAPKWAMQLLELKSSSSRSRLKVSELFQSGIAEGARDESLFRLACLLEREGIDCDTAKVIVTLVAERCTPPFSTTEAIRKVERAYTQYSTNDEVHGDRLARIRKAIGSETT